MSDALPKPTKEEMLKCLHRSGYLFESRLVRALVAMDFFVETSQALLDERTGKTREIDIVAESSTRNRSDATRNARVCVNTKFVIEALNNPLPVVLLNRKSWSPNTVPDDYLPYQVTPPEKDQPHPFLNDISHGELLGVEDREMFAQYCAFSRKKADAELMASHPDDLYSSIQKAVEYSLYLRELASRWMAKPDDDYWRIFNWQPVVALQNDLFILAESEQGDDLREVDQAYLEFNFHYRGEPKSVCVAFVTEAGFGKFIMASENRDEAVETKMASTRNRPA